MKPKKQIDPSTKFSALGLASDKQGGFLGTADGVFDYGANDDSTLPARVVTIDKIHPWGEQPRRYFSEEDIAALAHDFKTFGFHGAILTRPHPAKGAGHYLIVDGERSWRAARMAGIQELPCIVSELNDEQAMELAIAKNQLREDLTVLELTESIIRLIAQKTQRLVSEGTLPQAMGIDEVLHYIRTKMNPRNIDKSGDHADTKPLNYLVLSTVQSFNIEYSTFYAKYLRLLSLPDFLKRAHLEQNVSYRVILELEKLKPKGKSTTSAAIKKAREAQKALLNQVLTEQLSYRDVAAIIQTKRQDSAPKMSNTEEKMRTAFLESVKKIDQPDLWKDKALRQELEDILKALDALREKAETKLQASDEPQRDSQDSN